MLSRSVVRRIQKACFLIKRRGKGHRESGLFILRKGPKVLLIGTREIFRH